MRILVFLCLAGLMGAASPKEMLRVNVERAVAIDAPIARNMDKVQAQFLKLGLDKSGKPVDVVLDSPGGSVFTGFQFVNAMEEVRGAGTRIRCFVNGIAASMAFQILVHCDERYALSRSFLLWHGVRTQTRSPITSKSAANLHVDLQAIDDVILEELDSSLGISKDRVRYYFDQETLHIGQNLSKLAPDFISTHRFIPGMNEALTSPAVVKSSQAVNPFDFLFGQESGDIWYIYRGR